MCTAYEAHQASFRVLRPAVIWCDVCDLQVRPMRGEARHESVAVDALVRVVESIGGRPPQKG